MTQVPQTTPLGRAVAFTEALGHEHVFGAGTAEDPLFPVDVQLTGVDGNSVAVTGAIERAVRSYLRTTTIGRQNAAEIAAAVRKELWSVRDHGEFVERALALVRVS